MREIGNLNMSDFIHETEQRVVEKSRGPHRKTYVCSYCKYESNRQYNVMRHEERIHSTKRKPRTCCDLAFPTKGEYYLHCERFHPKKRSNATVSRTKYKILVDMIEINGRSGHLNREKRRRRKRRRRITFDDEDETEDETEYETEDETEDEEEEEEEENRTYVLRRRYSERIRQKGMETRTKSELTFQCSITYSELDRENIPLACFLNDRALREACFSSTPLATVNPSTKAAICKDAVRSTKKRDDPCESISDTTSSKENIPHERSWKNKEGGKCSSNEEEDTSGVFESLESSRRWTSLSESSSSSFIGDLPTKKLILRRFMTTMNIEIENTSQKSTTTVPLQERNPNVISAPQSRRSVKRCKRSFVSSTSSSSSYDFLDKENIPNLRLEDNVTVELDNSINVPSVTELHREFLSSIDFDNF